MASFTRFELGTLQSDTEVFRFIAITEDCQDGSNRRPSAGEYDNPSTAEIDLHKFELAIRFFPNIQALNTIPGPPTTALSRYSRIHDRALSFPLVTVEGSLPHWLAPRNPAYGQGWGFQGCAPRGTEFSMCTALHLKTSLLTGTEPRSTYAAPMQPLYLFVMLIRAEISCPVRFCRNGVELGITLP